MAQAKLFQGAVLRQGLASSPTPETHVRTVPPGNEKAGQPTATPTTATTAPTTIDRFHPLLIAYLPCGGRGSLRNEPLDKAVYVRHKYVMAITQTMARLTRDEFIERVEALLHHGNAPLALALADLDHFASINDTFGH